MQARVVIFVALFLVCHSLAATQNSPLVFARCDDFPETDVAEAVITRVMANLKIPIKIVPYPAARVTQEILGGKVIGEIERIASYGEKHVSLLRVMPPVYYLRSAVYAKKNRHITLSAHKDLQQYSVGVVRGIQHSDDATEGLDNVLRVSSSKSLFKMLQAGRTDLLITSELDGRIKLAQLNLTKDIEMVKELAFLETYIYLGPTELSLQQLLSQELYRMQLSGELKQVVENAERSLETGVEIAKR